MKLFTPLYDRALAWSRHPHAPRYLALLSFAEASFFPVPPDVMLMPMALSQPQKALRLALIATVASALGGLLGYAIGYGLWDVLQPWLQSLGYGERLAQVQHFFDVYGVWIVFAAGFSPIPYKLFTLTAGAMHMALLPFFIASVVGRGARFLLVALLMRWGGERHAERIRASVEGLGWAFVILLLGWLFWRWQSG
ncbi:YqaA family protein [Sulfurivirga sp.]|uniref:YqaA family protein n=1 Tax=Sulfurivirga sp. TaxID=2614236 RepID=UPI0025E876A8|nr:YqaA family protein [Sulfurivirga sp.]